MPRPSLHVVVPGVLETRTGGYGYDRQIIEHLSRRGWLPTVVSLPGDYPMPSAEHRAAADAAFTAIPDGSCALVDGLAFAALPDVAQRHQSRLALVALVHHPVGLETGLSPAMASRLIASEARALSCARAVIVTSRQTVAAVERLGVARDHIHVAEPGTDQRPLAQGSPAGGTHLLCVASLIPRKGHDTLLDALEASADLDWRLTCAGAAHGDAEYAERIRARATAGMLAGRVTFAGELSGTGLDDAFDAADLFVLPTRYEGYGMAVAEALARGLPVVSTPTGAIADLVGDTAGFLVAPDDAAALAGVVRLFITDRMVRSRLQLGARRARQRLQPWDETARQIEEALGRACRP